MKDILDGSGTNVLTDAEIAAMNSGAYTIASGLPSNVPNAAGPMLDNANFDSDVAAQVGAASPYNGDPYAGMTPEEIAIEKAKESGAMYGSNWSYDALAKKFPEVVGVAGAANAAAKKPSEMSDAYALLIATFKRYGLEELVPDIMKMMEQGMGANQAGLAIRETQAYKTRFAGNEQRRNAGMNVLTEDEYLNLEDSYSQTMHAYGLGSYFGTDAKRRRAQMADIIGGDVSAKEFADRIDTVVSRVEMADPTIKSTLKSFYNIGDTDLIHYFLNPKEGLPKLQEKVTSAEIGSEFIKQGLTTGVTSAEELAKLGVTGATAAKGTAQIAGFLPEATKLSDIYGEDNINYNQKTAEGEVFKGLASEKRKREKLINKEVGTWSGSAGTSKSSLGGPRGAAGLI